ncbi:HAD-IA family hydrolase [Aquimarina sp. U1-2]|uniref:HAD-IA family hydrolase n=1 Tax=Aquimarina sp. U1-2 TaxID=2823141 RepID=UPI001AECD411|nr:HAD-IA family hydrolase [Aquimarina sp. U1-2]MBP2832038.1 HAD-IA family hydrolase [Aquimarina sp. U1-2]
MKPKALFIGSIGTVAETSEYQRQAYNEAFKENNINWHWDVDTYKELLKSNGGMLRLETLSKATGKELTAQQIKSIHKSKTAIAGELIKKNNVEPRPGLKQLIDEAKEQDVKVAWVTTTYPDNTEAILEAFDGTISKEDFDHIFHKTDVENGKPSPECYKNACKHFDIKAEECIAIEDGLISLLAAKNAGIFTVATLGNYHDENVERIADLHFDELTETNWETLSEKLMNKQKDRVSEAAV